MAKAGPKNIFLSDQGSNFWPLGTRFGTIPDKELEKLPPLWTKLLKRDVATLNSTGAYLWLLFSKDRHMAVGRIEKIVHKVKNYLKKAEVFQDFQIPTSQPLKWKQFYLA